jgi:hypothetical protein
MDFRGHAARIRGVDLDPRVVDNPMLDEGPVADAGGIPDPDATFDLVFADNVLEHRPDPLTVFREIARVLKPGGVFPFKTPNKTHYMPTIARLTPHRFHQFVNRIRGRAEADTFPTRYRANTYSAVQRLAAASGFRRGERLSEAAATRQFLTDLGVPAAALLFEDRSRSTRENARYSAELIQTHGFARVLLVTSAPHMPRALATFHAAGIDAVPAPTDFEVLPEPPHLLRWLPDAQALADSTRALKEYLGLWVYRWRGWAV